MRTRSPLTWIDANPEDAVGRLRDHEAHLKALWRDHLSSRGLALGPLESHVLSAQERERLDRLFGGRGDRPWTGLSIFKLVAAVEAAWGSENEQFLLWHMHDVHLRYANLTLHATAQALWGTRRSGEKPDVSSMTRDRLRRMSQWPSWAHTGHTRT